MLSALSITVKQLNTRVRVQLYVMAKKSKPVAG